MINVISTLLDDVKIIEPIVYSDDRGFFYESFNQKVFNNALGFEVKFVQDNHSKSTKGVLRGLHYQQKPYEQDKLVRVINGLVYDVAVDLRPHSKQFGKWVGVYLSDQNKKQLFIPKGFAHGFLVLSESAEFLYKTSEYYEPKSEISIKWNDPLLNINWPDSQIITSEKDNAAISFNKFKEQI